jgi:hypothetical protein
MVLPLFAFVSLPRGNEPDNFAAQGVGHHKKTFVDLAHCDAPFLAVIGVSSLSSRCVSRNTRAA